MQASSNGWPRWSASSKRPRSVSIFRSTCAARPSNRGCGGRCARFRPARPPVTRKSPAASARQNRCARWRTLAPRTRLRSPFPAIGSCATTARSPAIAGASSASAPCSNVKRDHSGAFRGPGASPPAVAERVAALDWKRIAAELDAHGCAVAAAMLSPAECEALAALYASEDRFRSRVVMARHGFGRGEYKYFAYPLPGVVAALRTELYPELAFIANRWNEMMKIEVR